MQDLKWRTFARLMCAMRSSPRRRLAMACSVAFGSGATKLATPTPSANAAQACVKTIATAGVGS